MNIQEMHSAFRTLGQQMGMQLVRGILPESIDVYLNDVITLKTRTALEQSVRTAFMEQVDTQARSTAPANLLRSLYRRIIFNLYDFVKTGTGDAQTFTSFPKGAIIVEDTKVAGDSPVSCYLKYDATNGYSGVSSLSTATDYTTECIKNDKITIVLNNVTYTIKRNYITDLGENTISGPTPAQQTQGVSRIITIDPDVVITPIASTSYRYASIIKNNDKYYVILFDKVPQNYNIFSSIYLKSDKDEKVSGYGVSDVDFDYGRYDIILPTSKFYEGIEMQDTNLPKGKWINPMMYLGFGIKYFDIKNKTNSFVKARLIGADMLDTTLRDFNNSADKDNPVVTLLSDENGYDYIELFTNTPHVRLDQIDIRYIKQPNVVKFDTNPSQCVHCDLPEYCHFEIVEMAVMKFFQSIGANSNNSNNNNNNNQ